VQNVDQPQQCIAVHRQPVGITDDPEPRAGIDAGAIRSQQPDAVLDALVRRDPSDGEQRRGFADLAM
jgi:hypothetical protein